MEHKYIAYNKLYQYMVYFSFLELQDLRMSPIPSIRNRFGGRNSRNEAPDNFPPSFRINRGYSSASGSRSAGGLRRSASGTSSALDKARQVKKAFAFYYYYYFSFFLKKTLKCLVWSDDKKRLSQILGWALLKIKHICLSSDDN